MSIRSRLAALFGPERRSIENPLIPVSQLTLTQMLGPQWLSGSGAAVTVESAMSVPAVAAAIGFLSDTIATLPLDVYRRDGESRRAVSDGLARLLNGAPNPDMTSFDWRRAAMVQVLTTGRSFTFVERNGVGRIAALWLLDPRGVTVRRRPDGRLEYAYRDGGRVVIYQAAEVIDIVWEPRPDGLGHFSPIESGRNAIGLALSQEAYAARMFRNGGVPPLALQGPISSASGARAAAADVIDAVRSAGLENRQALVLPMGHELKPIGFDPAKNQMVEARRFQLEEIARLYRLPPVFLQDLTHGTFSNTEQQDLHVVKHRLMHICRQWEQQLNLKLFGAGATRSFVEFNQDALLRGDFKTRMEGLASAIQHGIATPNEARRIENRPDLAGGDRLLVQGAMVPLDGVGGQTPEPPNGTNANGDTNA